jgi:hypothetical protein
MYTGRGKGRLAEGWAHSSQAWEGQRHFAQAWFPAPPYALGLTDPALIS